jgi:hypothetical protein
MKFWKRKNPSLEKDPPHYLHVDERELARNTKIVLAYDRPVLGRPLRCGSHLVQIR